MKTPLVARILGALFLLAGIAGFLPFVTVPADMTAPVVTLDARYVFLAGLFPVNVVHDAIHLLFGVWGLLASRAFAPAIRYCRWVAVIYLALTVIGIIPITNTLFGIAPLYGHDIWLHLVIALLALYAGWGAPSQQEEPLQT